MRILYLPNSRSQQRQFEKTNVNIFPIRLAMEASYYAKEGHEVHWGEAIGRYDKIISEPEGLPFLKLPHCDRTLTKARSSIYQQNGNFKYHPGTYILSANSCWWGKCTFCVESKEKNYQVRPVEDVIGEIEECRRLGFKEVFDDSATFPTGKWLEVFSKSLLELNSSRGGTRRIHFGCNVRIDSFASGYDFSSLSRAGFRLLLFGIESANRETLDKIQKGVKVEDIIPCIKRASESGLEPHLAVMFGYPWETKRDADRTLRLVHYLLRKGYAKTAQASLYCPPDNQRNEAHKKYVKKIYNVGFDPRFWWVRKDEDIKYLWRGIKSWLG